MYLGTYDVGDGLRVDSAFHEAQKELRKQALRVGDGWHPSLRHRFLWHRLGPLLAKIPDDSLHLKREGGGEPGQ
jgi:hypothetical protein